MTVDGLFLASAPLFKSILLNLGIHPESQDKLAISMRALKDAYGMFGQLLTTLLLWQFLSWLYVYCNIVASLYTATVAFGKVAMN